MRKNWARGGGVTFLVTRVNLPWTLTLFFCRQAHRPSLAGTGAGLSRVVSVDEPSATTTATSAMAAVPDQKVAAAFHKELLDTCIDMLSRYAHFTSTSFPKRYSLFAPLDGLFKLLSAEF